MQLFDLMDKDILITGGTRGIGLAIVQGVRQAGDRIWTHSNSEDRIRRIAEENGFDYPYGGPRGQEGLDGMLRPLLPRGDRLGVLINDVGLEIHSAIENVEEELMDVIHNVNTKSSCFLLQELFPALKKARRASVINVASIHWEVPMRENGYYYMAKASLGMFTKVTTLGLARYGVRVNNLVPDAIPMDMNHELVEVMDFGEQIPIGRVDRADKLIGPAVFLASDAPFYVTGTTLYVNGGYSENLLRY